MEKMKRVFTAKLLVRNNKMRVYQLVELLMKLVRENKGKDMEVLSRNEAGDMSEITSVNLAIVPNSDHLEIHIE